MDNKKVFLLPGELCVSREPTEIATLLGSCVAICLYNRKNKFGGMNHYMLPKTPVGSPASGKHGDHSTETLIRMMLAHDETVGNIVATVLGGANVTGHLAVGTGIGANNILAAREILAQHRIPIVNTCIGGENGLKVYFKNWTGEIEVKKIEKSSQTRYLEERKKDVASRGIRVLVVDDSQTVRDILIAGISDDPVIEVVGQAADPYEAREMILAHDPDVICLDIIMPRMDGITFLKKLFLYKPKPVIIISTVAQRGSKLREQALQIGAVEVIDKEELQIYKGLDSIRAILIPKIKTAASVWVRKKTAQELESV